MISRQNYASLERATLKYNQLQYLTIYILQNKFCVVRVSYVTKRARIYRAMLIMMHENDYYTSIIVDICYAILRRVLYCSNVKHDNVQVEELRYGHTEVI